MLKPLSMLKFRVIARSEYEDRLIEALARVGLIHVGKPRIGLEALIPGELLMIAEGRAFLEEVGLNRVAELINTFCREEVPGCRRVRDLYRRVVELGEAVKVLEGLARLGVNLELLGRREFLFTQAGIVSINTLPKLLLGLKELRSTCAWVPIGSGEALVVVSGPTPREGEVLELLRSYGFKGVKLPQGIVSDPAIASVTVRERARRAARELVSLAMDVIKGAIASAPSRLTVVSDFLKVFSELEELLELTRKLLRDEGLEPPEELEKAVRREVVAEVVSVSELKAITEGLKRDVSRLRTGYASLINRLRVPKPPKLEVRGVTGASALRELRKVRQYIEALKAAELARKELVNLASVGNLYVKVFRYVPYVSAMSYLKDSAYRLRAFRRSYVVIAEGWVSREFAGALTSTVKELVPELVSITVSEPAAGEEAPVWLRHRGLMKFL